MEDGEMEREERGIKRRRKKGNKWRRRRKWKRRGMWKVGGRSGREGEGS